MKKSTDRSSLFLVELVIDLLLFALCAAVCVALLVRARGMSAESADLTQAVYLAQSAVEEWRSLDPDSRPSPGDVIETTDGGYEVSLTEGRGAPGLRECGVAVSKDGRTVYTLKGVAPW